MLRCFPNYLLGDEQVCKGVSSTYLELSRRTGSRTGLVEPAWAQVSTPILTWPGPGKYRSGKGW